METKNVEEKIELDGVDFDLEATTSEPEIQKLYTLSESTELPSKGKIYAGKNVSQFVKLRSMTTRDDMKRCAVSNLPLKNMAEMIEDCMIEKPAIPVYDMAIGDYQYLLHKLRVVTYGSEYRMSIWCDRCKKWEDCITDLDQECAEEFDYDEFIKQQIITLPESKRIIKLRYETPRMLDAISIKTKELTAKYKDTGLAYELLVTLIYLIEEVDEKKLNSNQIMEFVNRLKAKDMMYILNHSKKLNDLIGLNTLLVTACPECGGDLQTYFREGSEFFRPSTVE